MPLRVPPFHHEKHEDGGADEIDVAGLDGELADNQPPKAHKTSHENGGADEIDVSGLAGGYSSADLVADHPLLSGTELHDPKAHGTSHQNGEADEISVAGLGGELADDQPPKAHKATHEPTGADEINDVDIGNTGVLLSAHAARHENGEADEISVAGLGGELADDQPPKAHGADKHTDVTRDLVLELFPYVAGGGALHTIGALGGYRFESSATGMCYFKGKVPNDFVSFTDCNVIWLGSGNTAGQDWRMRLRLLYSAVGEQYDLHSEAPSDQVLDVTTLTEKIATDAGFSFTDLAVGDWIYVQVQRKGLESEDDYDGQIFIDSVLITYTAEQ